jgi:thiamine transporter
VFPLTDLIANPTSSLALLGTLSLILGFVKVHQEKLSTHTIVFAALMLALAVVLQQLRIFHMPQGGSVTAGAMVPLLLVSYRFGPGVGMLTGFLYGLLNLIQDPFILHPVQVLFDYPLPFMAMGLAGLSRNRIYLGTAAAFLTRFLCHFISGFVFFGSYAPAGTSPVTYSLIFNATYLVPEFIICCLILKLLPLKRLMNAAVKD